MKQKKIKGLPSMKTKLFVFLALFALSAFLAVPAFAVRGPQYNSLRAHGMGGACVAILDGKDALYYNPAGLNLINRLGNYEKDPERGYYAPNSADFRLFSFYGNMDVGSVFEGYKDVCEPVGIQDFIFRTIAAGLTWFPGIDEKYTWTYAWKRYKACPYLDEKVPGGLEHAGDVDQDALLDTLAKYPDIAQHIKMLVGRPLRAGLQVSVLEMAFHNFGFGIWGNTTASGSVKSGFLVPTLGYEEIFVDAVAQVGVGFEPAKNWSGGIGFKLVKRVKERAFDFYPLDAQASVDSLKIRWEKYKDWFDQDSLWKTSFYDYAIDLGALYQIRRDVRLGASLRNVFFGKLAGDAITPDLTLGVAYSPIILQNNWIWDRKVNFAFDYADILNDDRNYKFFSHINFGMEVEQVVFPGVARGRVALGFEGGYFSMGLGAVLFNFINLDFATWSEEGGYYTGQRELRNYAIQMALGF
jgi:hypothetical protein